MPTVYMKCREACISFLLLVAISVVFYTGYLEFSCLTTFLTPRFCRKLSGWGVRHRSRRNHAHLRFRRRNIVIMSFLWRKNLNLKSFNCIEEWSICLQFSQDFIIGYSLLVDVPHFSQKPHFSRFNFIHQRFCECPSFTSAQNYGNCEID